jgi:hypothetical protein
MVWAANSRDQPWEVVGQARSAVVFDFPTQKSGILGGANKERVCLGTFTSASRQETIDWPVEAYLPS